MVLGEITFSSSSAFLAFARSSFAFFNSSSSSSSNFRLTPLASARSSSSPLLLAGPLVFPVAFAAPSRPIIVLSNDSIALAFSSVPLSSSTSSASLCRRSSSFFSRLISFPCASRLFTAHSRQKMSPFDAHATGSLAIWRQSWQEAKGRKESRERRVAWEPHDDFSSERSWEVKKANEVLRLPWKRYQY